MYAEFSDAAQHHAHVCWLHDKYRRVHLSLPRLLLLLRRLWRQLQPQRSPDPSPQMLYPDLPHPSSEWSRRQQP